MLANLLSSGLLMLRLVGRMARRLAAVAVKEQRAVLAKLPLGERKTQCQLNFTQLNSKSIKDAIREKVQTS